MRPGVVRYRSVLGRHGDDAPQWDRREASGLESEQHEARG